MAIPRPSPCSHEVISGFRRQRRYFNTFAASPLQAAAGNTVIDEIEDRNLVTQVAEVGSMIRSSLSELQPTEPRMGDVRGHGLFIGIDWVHPGTTDPDVAGAASIVEAMIRKPKGGSVAIVAPIRTGKAHFHDPADFALMVSEGKLDGTTRTMTRYWEHGCAKGRTTGQAFMRARTVARSRAL